jgi:hypothetical protein
MLQRMKLQEFIRNLFDHTDVGQKVVLIIHTIIEDPSPRLSDISQRLPANPDANCKMLPQASWPRSIHGKP